MFKSLTVLSLFLLFSCENIEGIEIKTSKGSSGFETSEESDLVEELPEELDEENPEIEEAPSEPPSVALADVVDTGASEIQDSQSDVCSNFKNLSFDYSSMPSYSVNDNVIVSTANGGTAEVKEIGMVTGSGTPYQTSLDPLWGCTYNWYPGGAICVTGSDTDMGVQQSSAGSTWNNFSLSEGPQIGYITIDLGELKTIVGFDIFQMYSDGKATHIQIFAHSSLSPILPSLHDSGWSEITAGMTAIGPGKLEGNIVTNPLRLPLSSELKVRYLKVYAQNNGCLENPYYTEINKIRGYSKVATP